MKSFENVAGFGRGTLRLSLTLLSVVGAFESRPQEGVGIAQAWATWPEGAPAPNGTVMRRGHGVPEMVAWSTRDGDTGNEDNSSFARFFKLDNAMFSCHDKRLGE